MKDCTFCSLINQTDKELSSRLENTVLYEDDLVLIKPALGMSIPNYLMVISKQHINGFAELSSCDLFRLEHLLDVICEGYFKIIGIYPVIFEHGSLVEGRHSLSITHAHFHIIPINLSFNNLKKLFDELKLELKPDIISLHNMKHQDYWMYKSEEKHYYMSSSVRNAPRSCFIKIVAEQVGYDNSYEWRDSKNNRKADVKTTIEVFKKMKLDI
jgi:diadenosine tetraphosphate (Ap4A) HIT family hydrolase